MTGIQESDFLRLTRFIKDKAGINLNEKRTLIEGRLGHYIETQGFADFAAYVDYVVHEASGEAITELINRVSTNHTFFMRESDHFWFFRDQVLPWIEKSSADKDVRVWCAGCSSGEEAYTLAMLLKEFFDGRQLRWNTQLLATDISTKVLNHAMEGLYPSESVQDLPPMWRMNWINQIDKETSQIMDVIRNGVIFRKFNLMEPVFPFKKKFHSIFCRNVMIYFDNETKTELIRKYYEHTEPGGYLFIGHSESLGQGVPGWKYVRPAVFRRE